MSTRVTDLNLTIIPGKSIVTGEGNGKIGKMEELHTANKETIVEAVNEVKATADTAQTAAGTASTTAEDAMDMAEDAMDMAEETKTAADKAQTKAEEALSAAKQAQSALEAFRNEINSMIADEREF